jgi:prepilin-type N-terminal cleavage/methylation domain-containing protein
MRERGYTLVELLVVIAVIAILAAMLAPVILQAKESSKMRVCASNLRQLGTAIHRYMDDHNGYGLTQSDTFHKNPWILHVKPLMPQYLPGSKTMLADETAITSSSSKPPPQPKRMWVCPGDRAKGSKNVEQPFWWNCGSSYMYPGPTAYIASSKQGDPFAKQDLVPRKPMTWKSPKRDMLLADYWFDFHNHSGPLVEHKFLDGSLVTPRSVERAQLKCINVVFLDLHLGAITPSERASYIDYVCKDDNPHYEEPKP